MIGCFDRPIGWRLRALHLNGNRALRNVFCLRNFIAFIAFLAFFFLRKTLRALCALRAFEWKPGFTIADKHYKGHTEPNKSQQAAMHPDIIGLL